MQNLSLLEILCLDKKIFKSLQIGVYRISLKFLLHSHPDFLPDSSKGVLDIICIDIVSQETRVLSAVDRDESFAFVMKDAIALFLFGQLMLDI